MHVFFKLLDKSKPGNSGADLYLVPINSKSPKKKTKKKTLKLFDFKRLHIINELCPIVHDLISFVKKLS